MTKLKKKTDVLDRDTVLADVRAAHSALREAEAQVERTGKREADAIRIAATARAVAEQKRIDLGKALLRARLAWPERGPKAKGWGEFLKKEGIEQSTAWRYMELAGGGKDFMHEGRLHEIPHPADAGPPKLSLVPAPREPLQILADMQLLLGRWQDVLSTDEIGTVDAVITDAPYSEETHSGGREGTRFDGCDDDGLAPDYQHWTPADVDNFVSAWAPRTRGWMVGLCDHHLIDAWTTAYERQDRYVFAPVPCVIMGMTVRLSGDGPSSWAVYAMVSRPRSLKHWGTLPGAYVGPASPGSENGRGKPRWLMDAIVRDYSRANDLVCDPLAGYGTTLVSALLQRRRAIGAEVDEAAVKEAFERVKTINEPEPVTENENAA